MAVNLVGLLSPLGQKGLGRERSEFGCGRGWEVLGCVICVGLWCRCQSCSLDLHFGCSFASKHALPSAHVSTGACRGFVSAAFSSPAAVV